MARFFTPTLLILALGHVALGSGLPLAAVVAKEVSGASQPSLSEARMKLLAGDPAEAAGILEAVVKRAPENDQAWQMLGQAYLQAKKVKKARGAYECLLQLKPASPIAFYNIGVTYALQKNPDEAFHWLEKAKKTRKLDMAQAQGDADLANLKTDSRFAALLPEARDFADPFVEEVRIIHEWEGEAANDQFGWIARKLGDVDGDDVPDYVTSATTSGAGGESAGRVYVYSTKTGKLLWKRDGQANDHLGSGLEAAGDTNGDGIPDVVASAPGQRAHIYSGNDGRILLTLKAERKDENFGEHVAGCGDVNRDGFADVIVGAPPRQKSRTDPARLDLIGHAYVYSGKDGRLLLNLEGEKAGDGFGCAVTGYADKETMFLVVGASTAGPKKKGRVYVYDQLLTEQKFTIEADDTGKALGAMFVTVPGDTDGDGVPDIYVSDWSNEAKGPSTGRIYLHSGKDGHRLLTLTGETAGEGFGTCAAAAGDVDGDGCADLIVGSWQYGGAAVSGGRAYLYSGKSGKLLKTYTCRTPGDTFGFDAVGMGDTDDDGIADLLITSGWSAVSGFHSGRVFLISSGINQKTKGE